MNRDKAPQGHRFSLFQHSDGLFTLSQGLMLWVLLTAMVSADVVMPSARVTSHLNVRDLETNSIIGRLPKGASATFIDAIPDAYVVELANGIRGKVAKSWSIYIEGTTTSSIKIASFNIQIFGPAKAAKPAVMAELASIVRDYDVVAIQEIKDVHQQVPTVFLQTINATGAAYALVLSERGGQQPDDQHSQEQYAYYYNTHTLKSLDAGQLFDDSAQDHFQREPFIARFASVKGGANLCVTHGTHATGIGSK